MSVRVFADVDEFTQAQGVTLGPSSWVVVDQERIDQFAEATGDHQWIHVDPTRAADGPFGTTIAHGFLTLSLLPALWEEMYEVRGVSMGINYGLNKVRFISPVPSGSRVRATATIDDVTDVGTAVQAAMTTTVELEGSQSPALVAESIARYIP